MSLITDPRSRVFAAVLLWKFLVLVLFWQPIPTNDAFFYDGGVVNYLLHGQYVNPSLAINYPISGHQLFSAYPPLSQGILLIWMRLFGTSVFAAMTLHYVLYVLYALLLLGVLRRTLPESWTAHIAGLFLLGITFHDRPDSCAHTLGMLAVYAWVRAGLQPHRGNRSPGHSLWYWVMTAAIVLCLTASLQIGAAYAFLVCCGIVIARMACGERLPLAALAAMVLLPLLLIGGFVWFAPLFCRGFVESASSASFFTGLHWPRLMDGLKIIRAAPGVLAAAAMMMLPAFGLLPPRMLPKSAPGILGLAGLLTAIPVTLASLLLVSANTIGIAGYLQPLVVAGIGAWGGQLFPATPWRRAAGSLFLAGALLCSMRAIGLSTWGVACALDQSAGKSLNQVEAQISRLPAGSSVVLSGAYLYGAARHQEIRWIHSDHPGRFSDDATTALAALMDLKPACLVLTQFDYFRRYESTAQELMNHPEWVSVSITQTATLRAPDSIPSLRRVLQHVSWAPVIVDLEWKNPPFQPHPDVQLPNRAQQGGSSTAVEAGRITN